MIVFHFHSSQSGHTVLLNVDIRMAHGPIPMDLEQKNRLLLS